MTEEPKYGERLEPPPMQIQQATQHSPYRNMRPYMGALWGGYIAVVFGLGRSFHEIPIWAHLLILIPLAALTLPLRMREHRHAHNAAPTGPPAPWGKYPWQIGRQHPPEGVELVYIEGTHIPVEVKWVGWQGSTRGQEFEVVMPSGSEEWDRPTSLVARTWPGKTALIFPALQIPKENA